VKMCLKIFVGMISTMKVNADKMRAAAGGGFINATDLADWLVGKGLPFRSAYKISGQIVADCIKNGQLLETLPLETYRGYSELFDESVYEAVDLDNCVKRRNSFGGTSVSSVEHQIRVIKQKIN
ncbi:MAG: argininosuccinate lyase, partial [Clostridia bacterium]|nr:argininosuccinate lyase [Clostridia bacterium]